MTRLVLSATGVAIGGYGLYRILNEGISAGWEAVILVAIAALAIGLALRLNLLLLQLAALLGAFGCFLVWLAASGLEADHTPFGPTIYLGIAALFGAGALVAAAALVRRRRLPQERL